jgi:hypothetical protein
MECVLDTGFVIRDITRLGQTTKCQSTRRVRICPWWFQFFSIFLPFHLGPMGVKVKSKSKSKGIDKDPPSSFQHKRCFLLVLRETPS